MTPTKEIHEDYDATSNRETRQALRQVVELVNTIKIDDAGVDGSAGDVLKVAVDCAGSAAKKPSH